MHSNEDLPMKKRLRGKQAPLACASPCGLHLQRLLHMPELSHSISPWLDQRSLCVFGQSDAAGRVLAISPEVWQGQLLDLKRRSLRTSAQLVKVLESFASRWRHVRSIVFPQCNPSAAAIKVLRASLPALRSVDLHNCTQAGSLRLLAGLPFLEEIVLDGHLPKAPLPQLKVLEIRGMALELHGEGLEDWRRLPELVPKLEILRAPWLDDQADDEVSQDMWEKLHVPPLGCKTSDECLRFLQKMEHLREVDLSDVYTLSDAGLQILGTLPNLERLLLQNMGPRVTVEGLWHLADSRAPLGFLDLQRCLSKGHWQPQAGRTALRETDILAFQRRRPTTQVCFS